MCGIFGFQFRPRICSEGRRAMLAGKLAELNDERGGHSWGYAVMNGEVKTDRGLGKMGGFASRMIGAESVLAHTRWATHGEKTVENAHPFEIGEIIGAHNGVIYNHKTLCEKYNRDFPVDSMHLFAHLNEGLEASWSDFDGYGSIEWVKKSDPSTVYLCRMDGGDLAVYGIGEHGKDVRGVVWSSDEDHLIESLKFAGFKNYFKYRINAGQVYSVTDGMLYELPDRKLEMGESLAPRKKWSDYTHWSEKDDNVFPIRDRKTDDKWVFPIEDDELDLEASRREVEEDELDAYLVRMGFHEIELENLTFEEKESFVGDEWREQDDEDERLYALRKGR